MSYTICISGSEKTRAKVEVALEQARIPILPDTHHEHRWGDKVPVDAGEGCLVVDHLDIDDVVQVAEPAGWRLRTHHEACAAPEEHPLVATIAEMRRELAELKAKVG